MDKKAKRRESESPIETAGLFVVVIVIRNSKRRAPIVDTLRFCGTPIGPNVFEVAATAREMRRVEMDIGQHLEEGDVVRIYPVCKRCRSHTRLFGSGELAAVPAAYIF